MHTKYYSRFQIISHNPLWKVYLRWAYRKGINDLENNGKSIDFSRKNFTALLCGTSGEITSLEFAKFIFSKNPDAKVIILDISSIQLEKSKKTLNENFPKKSMEFIRSDAKKTKLKNSSIDYIETDGILEYFSKQNLELLMREWKRILKKGGFVTTRAFASNSFFGRVADNIRLFIGKYYLGVVLYAHTFTDLSNVIKKAGLVFIYGGLTFCPTYKRFSMFKQ